MNKNEIKQKLNKPRTHTKKNIFFKSRNNKWNKQKKKQTFASKIKEKKNQRTD